MHVCIPYVWLVPLELRRNHRVPWGWSDRYCEPVWVLGITPRFSTRAASALNHESSHQPLYPLLIESCLCCATLQGPASTPNLNRKCLCQDRHRRALSLRSKAIAPESWTQLHSEHCLPDSSCVEFYWQSLHIVAWLCHCHHITPHHRTG